MNPRKPIYSRLLRMSSKSNATTKTPVEINFAGLLPKVRWILHSAKQLKCFRVLLKTLTTPEKFCSFFFRGSPLAVGTLDKNERSLPDCIKVAHTLHIYVLE